MRIAVYVTGLDGEQKLDSLISIRKSLIEAGWDKAIINTDKFKLTAFKQTEPTEHDELALFENHKKALEQ